MFLNMPIKVAKSDQTCALGAAMAAAVVAGVYPDMLAAQNKMGNGFELEFIPNADNARQYEKLYAEYSKIGSLLEFK